MVAINNISEASRIVIKVGSSLVTSKDGNINEGFLDIIASDLLELRNKNKEIIIVSSGAVSLGNIINKNKNSLSLSESQAASSIGQIKLINGWKNSLEKRDLKIAQILITADDTENRRRYLNARSTFEELLKNNYIPIINENDTVATAEIRYGDNDRLAARVAGMLSADCLILLSNVNGLYSKDPKDEKSELIKEVSEISKEIMSMAGDASQLGSGGMITKLEAAKICMSAGSNMVIASGNNNEPLLSIKKGVNCTWFNPETASKNSLKIWLSGQLKPSGKIFSDPDASKALLSGNSLLSAGVTSIEGDFDKGDTLLIFNNKNIEIARGLSNYSSEDLKKIIGKNSEEIKSILGYMDKPEIIHKDNLVFTAEQEK
ncbi:glutamate 5-kinase [Hyphomicrobiales bacterium]|nr:glutamate 5-kinase [Hyphomicrobiales bacterium]